MDYGHWKYIGEFVSEDWFGFIYRIIDTTNGRHYLGKKQFNRHLKKKVKTKVGTLRNKKIVKESDWKTYTSSSVHVNQAIDEKGKENFIFLIESLHKSKAGLFYAEIEYQVNEDVLRAKLPCGGRKYYNGMVGNVKFIPPVDSDLETQHRICRMTRTHELNVGHGLYETLTDEQRAEWDAIYRVRDR